MSSLTGGDKIGLWWLGIIIALIIVIVVVLASYSTSTAENEKLMKLEEERSRKQQFENMKTKIRAGQLTQKIFCAIDKANSLGLSVFSMLLKERIDYSGHYIEIIYYGNVSKISRPYKAHPYDEDKSERRDKNIRVVCEQIECSEIQNQNEIIAFAQVLLEKLGTEKYEVPDNDGWAIEVLVCTKKASPWLRDSHDWQSNPNWM